MSNWVFSHKDHKDIPGGDASKVIYSGTLMERISVCAILRPVKLLLIHPHFFMQEA